MKIMQLSIECWEFTFYFAKAAAGFSLLLPMDFFGGCKISSLFERKSSHIYAFVDLGWMY